MTWRSTIRPGSGVTSLGWPSLGAGWSGIRAGIIPGCTELHSILLQNRHNASTVYESASAACYSPVSRTDTELERPRLFHAKYMAYTRARRVLVIEDERDMAEWLSVVVSGAGYDTRVAVRGDEAAETFSTWLPDAALVDLMLPDTDGAELVRRFKALQPRTEVLVVSGQGSIPRAVEAIK